MSAIEPKAWFHGTAQPALRFHPTAVAYFTSDEAAAGDHARMDAEYESTQPRVVVASLAVTNPIAMEEASMQDLHANPQEVLRLQSLGYDCAIAARENSTEIAVFGNSRISIENERTLG